MSNEEQVADTIEMLYERLNSYNKQDLFNYGYLLESNEILCKDIEEKDKEIERLNNIIKEVREYLNKNEIEGVYLDCKLYETKVYKDILEILDKGSEKE